MTIITSPPFLVLSYVHPITSIISVSVVEQGGNLFKVLHWISPTPDEIPPTLTSLNVIYLYQSVKTYLFNKTMRKIIMWIYQPTNLGISIHS